ncbi:MAG: DUF134 domain-containing protein [Desulfovibrio sp.]|nr:DUF134 domain-containing protein [Desulfovibrio sp.]MCA1986055.1 DUF134 domain-containing protein [Desulfovibrio sp.]
MPRPRKCRRIGHSPVATLYKPQGVPGGLLKGVVLPLDGLEAMRLVDGLGMDQEAAAAQMGVSRPTLGRMLAQARGLVARALASGWAIRIEHEDAQEVTIQERSACEETPPPHECRRRACCARTATGAQPVESPEQKEMKS